MNYFRMQNQWTAATGVILLCLAFLIPASLRAESVAGKVVIIPITDEEVSGPQELYQLEQVLDKVKDDQASAIVFDLNVSGGDAAAVAKLVRERVAPIEIPVVAWANPSATGAGGVLAVGSDAIMVSPLGTVGGIEGPETSSGNTEGKGATSQQSSSGASALRAAVRSIAEAKGHDLTLVEAFVDPKAEIDGLVEKDLLLTLTSSQAITAGFASKAESLKEVLASQNLEGSEPVEIEGLREFLRPSGTTTPSIVESETRASSKESPKKGGDGLFSRAEEESFVGKIVIIEIVETDELVLKSRFEWFERTIQKASDDGANAVILDMNTPGGRLWETQDLMMSILAKAKCRTVTFVNPNAISAGSMIAISTDAIYMAPASVIGAAKAVTSIGGELNEGMEAKVSSVQIAAARNMAILKGHNPDIAEAFISIEKELQLGPIDDGPETLLALNADQAIQLVDGKPLLAKGIASTVEEVIEQEGLTGEIHRPEPYGLEQFAMWVERLSSLLIVIGIAGAYLEIKAPGFGIPGFVSVLAFTIFFFGNYVAGNLAGWEVAVVFVLGIILVLLELFILPGTMIAGFIGIVLILGSLGFAMVDRVDFDLLRKGTDAAPGLSEVLLRPVLNLSIGLLVAGLLVMAAVTFLPQTRLMNWMVLDTTVGGGDAEPTAEEESETLSLVGKAGVAFTDLRPSGKVSIGGDILDATSNSEFVERGGNVRIVAHEGGKIVVEACS